jgi:hypothetical protein
MSGFDRIPIPIDGKECKHFKNLVVTCPISEDRKIVTIDSEKKILLTVYDCPDRCKICNKNRTCIDLHLSILADKYAHKKRVWIRNAGQYAVVETQLGTEILDLKKMSKVFDNLMRA